MQILAGPHCTKNFKCGLSNKMHVACSQHSVDTWCCMVLGVRGHVSGSVDVWRASFRVVHSISPSGVWQHQWNMDGIYVSFEAS
jgi:hypothetical protein